MRIQQAVLVFILCTFSTISLCARIPDVLIDPDNVNAVSLKKSTPLIIISHKQIVQSGASSIAQILASQSVIQLQDLTGDGSQVAAGMRGFGANAASNTLILINGIPQNNPDMASVNVNEIPIQDVERIEILPGSQSVLYGDQAVAGAINIITKKPLKPHAAVSVGGGSYDHQTYNARVSNVYNNGFSYLVNANVDASQNYRRHNQDNQRSLLTDLGYQYATGLIDFRYNFYHQILQYPGALTPEEAAQNRRQQEPGAPNNTEHAYQHAATLNWKQIVNKNWVEQSVFSYHDFFAQGLLYGAYKQKRRLVYINPKMIGTYALGTLTVGSDFSHDFYVLNSVSDYDKAHQYTMSAYSLWHEPFAQEFALNVGSRVAYLGGNGYPSPAWVTSLALLWQPNSNGSVYVRRAGNYRFPKADENAVLAPGVSHLKTQTGASYDIGYKYAAADYHASIDLYYMAIQNEIVFDPTQTATQPFGFNRNLSPTHHQGLDVSAGYEFNSVLRLDAQYSYVDAIFSSGDYAGKQVPFVSANKFHLSALVKFASQWSLFAESIVTGKKFASGDDSNSAAGIPAYVIFNSSVGYHNKRFSVRLRVNNIFNCYYNAYASLITYDDTSTEYVYPAPGRVFMLTTSVNLW